jgi:hypothetical protein
MHGEPEDTTILENFFAAFIPVASHDIVDSSIHVCRRDIVKIFLTPGAQLHLRSNGGDH